MMRTKAYRRHQATRVQRKRWLDVYHRWFKSQQNQALAANVTIGSSYLQPYTAAWQERFKSRLRDGNTSCGCVMCKPWKYGARWGDKYKISEMRQLDSVKDKSEPEEPDDAGNL